MATEIDPELEAELLELLAREMKVHAIKLYRERTGAGLKEGYDVVQRLEQSRGDRPPEAADDLTGEVRSGCLSVVLLGLGSLW
jgi:ribosomal protein L7/L12